MAEKITIKKYSKNLDFNAFMSSEKFKKEACNTKLFLRLYIKYVHLGERDVAEFVQRELDYRITGFDYRLDSSMVFD